MTRMSRVGAAAFRLAAITVAAAAAVSCGIERQSAPELTGPSEFGTSITLQAAPDVVARDGASQSTIALTARDAGGAPVAGLALVLGISPVNGGTLSASQVVTDSAGRATFAYTAPDLSTPVESVRITATPIGSNFAGAMARFTTVALAAPAAATPQFTVSPASPQRFQSVTLNATGSTYAGQPCGSACTYSWTVGSEATLSGQVATYRFQQQATYVVTLDVTSPGGVTTRTHQNVTVAAGTPPTAAITVSPSNPRVNDTVYFNGASSTAANGATITEYTWDFGNGQVATGATATTVFTAARSYVVRLTVRDSNGQTATVTQQVTVI